MVLIPDGVNGNDKSDGGEIALEMDATLLITTSLLQPPMLTAKQEEKKKKMMMTMMMMMTTQQLLHAQACGPFSLLPAGRNGPR